MGAKNQYKDLSRELIMGYRPPKGDGTTTIKIDDGFMICSESSVIKMDGD